MNMPPSLKSKRQHGGGRVQTTDRTGRAHGITKVGEKNGTVKWDSKILTLKDGKVHMGMAIDAYTNQE